MPVLKPSRLSQYLWLVVKLHCALWSAELSVNGAAFSKTRRDWSTIRHTIAEKQQIWCKQSNVSKSEAPRTNTLMAPIQSTFQQRQLNEFARRVPRLHISPSSLTADRDASWQLTQRPKKNCDLIVKNEYANYTEVWVRSSTNKNQLVLLSTTCDLPLNGACLACQRLPASWQWLPTCWCLQKSAIHAKIHSDEVGHNCIINGTLISCMDCSLVSKGFR